MTDRRPRHTATVRTRILAGTLLVVAIALGAMILITGRTLFSRVDEVATTELGHEADKLRAFAARPDPDTGRPFATVRELLTSHLAHNVTEQGEASFSIVSGRADRRSHGDAPARLDADAAFVARAAGYEEPASGRTDTSAGPALYAVLPVHVDGDPEPGSLVVVEFLGPATEEAWSIVATMSVAAVSALVLSAIAGGLIAGRALRPIREVRETAARIGGTALDRRIDVVGDDDVALLATTFNDMLDRVQSAFDGQRRFLDDAGHELRTPITVIRGHLEVMGEDEQERARTIHLVGDELSRMSRLVDDLILLARSERPDFLVRRPVPLADLVVETLTKATALAPRSWTIDAVPEGVILADGQRLTQALLQLVANAVAHTVDGAVIALGGAADDDEVRLWVRDEGTGIPEGEQDRIFDRFARGSSATRGGSGLGLAIVSRIAQGHGGRVNVRSSPGAGARFTVTLPRRTREEAP